MLHGPSLMQWGSVWVWIWERTVKEGYRFVGFPWRTPEGKVVKRVIFAPDVTGDEAYEVIMSLGWLYHKDAEE